MTIPYNPASPKAEEFINHQEILDTLAFADERSKIWTTAGAFWKKPGP